MTLTSTVSQDTKPAVLLNRYPVFDSAGNKLQQIRLRFICGHEEEFFSLALGKGWRARTDRQLKADYLQITCPTGWRVCSLCARGGPCKVCGGTLHSAEQCSLAEVAA